MSLEPASAWEQIRHAYVETPEPIKSICARFGITPQDLATERKARGWPPRPSPIRPKSTPPAHQPPPRITKLRRSSARSTKRTPAQSAKTKSARTAQAHQADARPKPPSNRAPPNARTVAKRLATIISRKLDRMEQQLADGDLPTLADSEREARALGVMIQNFERLKALGQPRHAEVATDATATSANATPPDGMPNVDDLRNDLAQRLARLVNAGPADSDSGTSQSG